MKKINSARKLEIAIINLHKKIVVGKPVKNSIVSAIRKTLKTENIKRWTGITICLVTDADIKAINRKYLGRNHPTDVIAFNLEEKSLHQGILTDIVVSIDTANRNAKIFKTTLLNEITIYVIHGLLHALGYDDSTAAARKMMENKTAQIVSRLK